MQPVTVVMTTYFPDLNRRYIAQQTVQSWAHYLGYEGDLSLHVADDGTKIPLELDKYWGDIYSYTKQEAKGVGASLNKGFKHAFDSSPFVLYAVDDWRLTKHFDLAPWVYALEQNENIGAIRLGPPHPNLVGTIDVVSDNWQGWCVYLDRTSQGIVVSHRPTLFHKRFFDHYGYWLENCSAIECERDFDKRYKDDYSGPDVIMALPHPWYTEGESLSELNPKDRK